MSIQLGNNTWPEHWPILKAKHIAVIMAPTPPDGRKVARLRPPPDPHCRTIPRWITMTTLNGRLQGVIYTHFIISLELEGFESPRGLVEHVDFIESAGNFRKLYILHTKENRGALARSWNRTGHLLGYRVPKRSF